MTLDDRGIVCRTFVVDEVHDSINLITTLELRQSREKRFVANRTATTLSRPLLSLNRRGGLGLSGLSGC
jgi:hypothetical protein